MECKTTSKRSYILKLQEIEKIKSEALMGNDPDWALQVEFQTQSGNKKFAVIDWATFLELRSSTAKTSQHCEECGCEIPDVSGGGVTNLYHAESCSLFSAGSL